jgi:hypothetical protein
MNHFIHVVIMRAKATTLIIICLLFLVGTAAAIIPDTVTITSDKSYVFAGSGEQSTITVTVWNTSDTKGVQNANVFFSVNSTLGTLNPINTTTSIDGNATSVFNVKTKSDFAVITARVIFSDLDGSYDKVFNFTQKIDHNKAYYAKFSHPLEGEVDTIVPFKISFTDYYGNPIDQLINSGQQHTINLHVYGPPPNNCSFVGYGHDILNQRLDPYGNVSVQVKLSSGAGPNSVTMDQFELIPPPSQRIITAVSSDVSEMKYSVNPASPPGVPADGTNKFSITYTLYDKFRNPASQQLLWVNTSVGGNTTFKTDNLGQIAITYGPRTNSGVITIDATAVANPLVNSSFMVEFTSTAATTIVLMANPEVMVSRDKNSAAISIITAKITNIMGGPAAGETVMFSLGTEQYPGGPYNVTNFSSFSLTSVLTTIPATSDGNGDATVNFYPGSFHTNPMAVNYSSTATGQVKITATWTNSSGTTFAKDILVKWKNYPYLSAKTSVNPDSINVNETVDVTINLNADGWAIQPKPIDVVLVIDRSGSMGNYKVGSDTRLEAAQNAAISFVNNPNMTEGTDRIGLVSYSQEDTVTRDADLGTLFSTVRSKISALSSGGGTAMREGFKQSIDHMKVSGRPNAVRAIILMTDGNWNYGGSPLAVGKGYDKNPWVQTNRDTGVTTQSSPAIPYYGFSGWATDFEDQDYRWYSGMASGGSISASCKTVVKTPRHIDVTSGNDVLPARTTEIRPTAGSYCDNGQFTEQNMSIYAKNNNIRLYTLTFASNVAPDEASALSILANSTGGFYRHAPDQAALEKVYADIAGELKDTAGVDTKMVADFSNVNVTGVTIAGADVFDYVYHPPVSTTTTWKNSSTTSTTVTDQSLDWANDNKLNFTIGTMKVGDTWETTFRLKVKKSGSIDVFGPNSALYFNNSGTIENLVLPRTFLTVMPNLTTGFELKQIDVIGSCAITDPNKAILPITWITTYTGGPTDIFDEVNYIDETGAHITFYKGSYHVTNSTSTPRMTTFDMKTVPQGQYYDIEVRTFTANAQDSTLACSGFSYNTTGKTFIKLD